MILNTIISAILFGIHLLRGRAETAISGPMTDAEVDAMLTIAAKAVPEATDWRQSIVDLMKILHLNPSLAARKMLAEELGYTGSLDGSAAMNIWLHKAVMDRVAKRIIQP